MAGTSEEPKPDSQRPEEITPSNDGSMSSKYPSGLKLALIIFGLQLSIFCVALDNTIISTAIPRITDQFHALQDVGWYGSAYLLTTCAFQLLFGKLYVIFNVKWIFFFALFLFELGSLICAIAPNSIALIWGRAIAGLGSAGIFSGALVIIAISSPVDKRAAYQSMVGAMYGVASIVGPLIGGAFTDNVTWRWCFYINLPIGAVTAFFLLPALKLPPGQSQNKGLARTIWNLDPIGTVLFVPSIVCLLLALQWGGTTYAWSSGRITALFVVFGVLLIAFVITQITMGELATVPPRIAKQRTIAFASLFSICLGGGFFLFIYFLPLWFQAIKGTSALHSGIDTIALILSNVIAIIASGALTTKFGQYMPWFFLSVVLTSVGSGLLTTLSPLTSAGRWIGYQILYGYGVGSAFQLPQIAAQNVLSTEDAPVGIAITLFMEMFGGALFVSVGNNVFNDRLVKYVSRLRVPDVDPVEIVKLGATQLRSYVHPEYAGLVIQAYNHALIKVFQVGLILSCLSLLGAAGMQWKSIKTDAGEEKENGET